MSNIFINEEKEQTGPRRFYNELYILTYIPKSQGEHQDIKRKRIVGTNSKLWQQKLEGT